MRATLVCLIAPMIVAVSTTALPAQAATPPSPDYAAVVIAGEPEHGRVQPIGVIAGHTWALPVLIDGLAFENPDIRARCAFLLGQIASADAHDALAKALNDPDRNVRMFAGIALARMGDAAGFEAARAAYYGNRWWIRYWAVDALARLDRVPEVALGDPDPLVRALAEDGRRGAYGPAMVEVAYSGPEGATFYDTIFELTDYLIGETDWWWHAGHYEQIIRANETIVWLDLEYIEGLTNAAYLYWSLGRDGEALATYRRAVARHPEKWEAHFELGFFYYNAQKRYADAVSQFKRARELDCPPEQARMHAHALEKAGRVREAWEVWREFVMKRPDDGVAHQNFERLESIVGAG